MSSTTSGTATMTTNVPRACSSWRTPRGAGAVGRARGGAGARRYGVNLVVLNACDSAQGTWVGLAPSLVRAEIPAVVAGGRWRTRPPSA